MPSRPDTSLSFMSMATSHEKKCQSCIWSIVKCCWKVNFKKVDIEPLTGINDGFSSLWGIFKEYIKQDIIMTELRKENSHCQVDIFRLMKNQ